MSSFCLYSLNWWSGTECWSSCNCFRASYKFLRQHEVLHRLHASIVPFDASCAWNVCVIRESSSACTNFIQPREFRGFGSGCGWGFISDIWLRGPEWADSEASRQRIMHIMKDRSVQELRTFLDVLTLQDEDITFPRNVANWLLIDTASYPRRTESFIQPYLVYRFVALMYQEPRSVWHTVLYLIKLTPMLTFRTLISTPAYTNVFDILVVLLVLTPSAHQIFSLFILSSHCCKYEPIIWTR